MATWSTENIVVARDRLANARTRMDGGDYTCRGAVAAEPEASSSAAKPASEPGLRNPDSLANFVEFASGDSKPAELTERQQAGAHVAIFGFGPDQKPHISAVMALARLLRRRDHTRRVATLAGHHKHGRCDQPPAADRVTGRTRHANHHGA